VLFSIIRLDNGAENVTFADANVNEALAVTRGTSTYAGTDGPTKYVKNIKVHNINAKTTTGNLSTGTAIRAQYCDAFSVTDCVISGYNHGIAWWGGDSNTSVDGAVENERKAKNIIISNNNISDIKMGGIWGSMGENITITGNNVRISGNTVSKCHFGGITTFYICRNVSIVGNSVTAIATEFVIKIYNSTASAYASNSGYTISGNALRCEDETDVANFSIESSSNVNIVGNTLTNVKIIANPASGQISSLSIANNTFNYLSTIITPFTALTLAKARVNGHHIKNNRLFSTATLPAGSIGLFLVNDDGNSSPVYVVESNEFKNFTTDISLSLGGTNAGQGARVLLRNNRMASLSTIRSGGYNSTLNMEGNKNSVHANYPGAVPTEVSKWERGQQFLSSTPSAAGTIGWICTTAGWINSVAWVTATAYAVGDFVNADSGKVYVATTAGTSATSPTGTGTAIADGDVVWRYVGPVGVFKTFGTISA
jgi:hypothetical protein